MIFLLTIGIAWLLFLDVVRFYIVDNVSGLRVDDENSSNMLFWMGNGSCMESLPALWHATAGKFFRSWLLELCW